MLVDFGLLDANFFDEQTLPQTEVDVLQAVDGFVFEFEPPSDDLRRQRSVVLSISIGRLGAASNSR